jgi:putative ABC transport system permease protein
MVHGPLKALRRAPAFTFGVVVPLSLAFSLAAIIVAVANAYLIRPLPYPAADRVYHVMYAPPGPWEPRGLSGMDWASVSDVVEYPLATSADTFFVNDGAVSPPLRGRRVTFGLLAGLGVQPAAGRLLIESDFQEAGELAVLIGHSVWRDRFGFDSAAVGRALRTETEAGRVEQFRIVGVLPPDFYVGGDSTQPIDVIVPMDSSARRYYMVRLRPGVPPALAEQRLTEAALRVATDVPADWSGVHLESARERYAGRLRPVLIGITIAAALLLVIAFANVAVLVVLRTARRRKEMALRFALGSTNQRLLRSLAGETCALLVIALSIALFISRSALAFLAPLIEAQLGRSAPGGTASIAVDTTVLLIIAAAGMLAVVTFTLMPLAFLRQGRLATLLQRSSATTDGLGMRRLRSTLLVVEVAMTLVLLAGCGLMIRSVATMARMDVGFAPDQLARARISLRPVDYADQRSFSRFFERFIERADAAGAPVVFSSWPPFAEFPEHAIEMEGRDGHILNAGFVNVGPNYFSTLGIALRSGRAFSANDVGPSASVAVISESMAKRLWPAGDVLGRRVRQILVTPRGPEPPGPWQTVIGVAADVRQSYGDTNMHDIYSPWIPDSRFGSFYTRTARPLASVTRVLRGAAGDIDPRAVVNELRAVTDENRERADATFLSMMLAGFALVAATIAVLGIYGVTAYSVQQRERELAIRMALGAGGRAIASLFLRESGVLLAAGLVAGLGGAVAVARVLEHRIFGVQRFDGSTLAVTSALMAATWLIATWWPARRASHKDPAVSLRDI